MFIVPEGDARDDVEVLDSSSREWRRIRRAEIGEDARDGGDGRFGEVDADDCADVRVTTRGGMAFAGDFFPP
jgi:hypothetical protein